MKTTSRTQFKEIFEAVVDLPISERANLLADRCAGNDKMRSDIERLLAADDAAGGFLESSPFYESANALAEIGSRKFIGQTIGAYHIEREIGAGGMGTVFLATRDLGGASQKVAIKIVHQGAHSKEIIRRFLIERKILAGLEHSGIARLIDAGETPDGLPFLVMEYIDGKPLDEYCRAKNRSIEDRLLLFRKVCAAVAYAHRRLIIHRDLKPSNILATDDGEPKLLDFGIAKLLAPVDAETPQTATLMNLLTPAYAAPEQIRGETITTATDVYSLGVILYELLAGVRPFAFGDKNFQEIVRVICETDPPKPSEASTLRNRTSDTAERNDPVTGDNETGGFKIVTNKSLRGDLDNIVLKALRKDPERRYQSVEQFSEDIGRYLKGLPVSARPDTFSYRATKFFQRNRLAVASSALIVLLLIGGIVGTTWQAMRAARQQQIAEQRFAQVRELANNVVFKYYDEIEKLSGSTKLRETLVSDALRYLDSLSQDAAGDVSLQKELAEAYLRIARVQDKHFEPNLGKSEAAIDSTRKAVSILEPLVETSDDEQIRITLANSYIELASNLRRKGNFTEAGELLEKALAVNEKTVAASPDSTDPQIAFAQNLIYYGDLMPAREKKPVFQTALEISEKLWRLNPNDTKVQYFLCAITGRLADNLMILAKAAHEVENYDHEKELRDEAVPYYRRSVEIAERIYAVDSANVFNRTVLTLAHFNESELQAQLGQFDSALKTQQDTLLEYQRTLAADPENQETEIFLADMYCTLAATYGKQGDFTKSSVNFRASLQTLDKIIGKQPDNFEARRKQFDFTNLFADELLLHGDGEKALRNYDQAFAAIEAATNDDNKNTIKSLRGVYLEKIGDCRLKIASNLNLSSATRQKAFNDAQSAYQKAIEILETSTTGKKESEKIEYLKRKKMSGEKI